MTTIDMKSELTQLMNDASNHETEVRRTHESLWELLARCYKILLVLEADDTQFEALCKFAAKHDTQARKTTARAGLLVRVVFGKQYEQSYACTQTLKVMRARNVSEATFVEWLRQNGGVNKVRRMPLDPTITRKSQPTPADTANKIKERLSKQTAKAKISYDGDLPDVDGLALAVLRKNAHGEIEIVDIVQSDDAMTKVWAAIGIELKYENPEPKTPDDSLPDVIEAAAANAVAAKEAA